MCISLDFESYQDVPVILGIKEHTRTKFIKKLIIR